MAPLEIGTLYYVEEAIYKAEKAKLQDVCALYRDVHNPRPNPAYSLQALVTAKFAGLSMPTKKFDPQKDGRRQEGLAFLTSSCESQSAIDCNTVALKVCALKEGFKRVFDPNFRKPFPKTCQWFEKCCKMPQFKTVLGDEKEKAEPKVQPKEAKDPPAIPNGGDSDLKIFDRQLQRYSMPLTPAKVLPCAGDSPIPCDGIDSDASTTILKTERDDTLAWRIACVMEERMATQGQQDTRTEVDQSLLERKVHQTIKLLQACRFCSHDIVLCFSYACSYAGRVFPLMAGLLGDAEAVHICILLVFLAHCFVLDETCPMREWHKHIFRRYCSLKKMDTALFSIFSMLEFHLSIPAEEEATVKMPPCQNPWRMLVAPICAFLLLVAIVVAVVLAVAHNSGGATPTPSPPPPLPSGPLRGLAYAPLPCIAGTCKEQLPNSDVMQIGYEKQWGSGGRNDLNVIKKLGGNAIRLYHSFGFGPRSDHGLLAKCVTLLFLC
eukprot:s504_g14.t1